VNGVGWDSSSIFSDNLERDRTFHTPSYPRLMFPPRNPTGYRGSPDAVRKKVFSDQTPFREAHPTEVLAPIILTRPRSAPVRSVSRHSRRHGPTHARRTRTSGRDNHVIHLPSVSRKLLDLPVSKLLHPV
jgi:hypothetical protein